MPAETQTREEVLALARRWRAEVIKTRTRVIAKAQSERSK